MAGILDWMKRDRGNAMAAARALCEQVMARSRTPDLYLAGYAEDTFEGRFAMAALHGGLVMRRLRAAGSDGLAVSEKLGEALFDRFDYALREEGVGDASIARKARKLGEEFFGLARALDGVLAGEAATEAGLAAVLQRNGLGGAHPEGLARYVRQAAGDLERCRDEDLLCGEIPEWR